MLGRKSQPERCCAFCPDRNRRAIVGAMGKLLLGIIIGVLLVLFLLVQCTQAIF
ncbi:MAG: hypothetical protein M3N29_10260 [Chloroflexota bacterium]|nr:hypothetical protein [Chloroflexota bacterium]